MNLPSILSEPKPEPEMRDLAAEYCAIVATDKELQQKLTTETNPRTQLHILIELNTRQTKQIAALTNRIALLEEKALKKAGRKRVPIFLDGRELTDDDILYYIDEDYYTIVE